MKLIKNARVIQFNMSLVNLQCIIDTQCFKSEQMFLYKFIFMVEIFLFLNLIIIAGFEPFKLKLQKLYSYLQ
jgi:hypothetical protein